MTCRFRVGNAKTPAYHATFNRAADVSFKPDDLVMTSRCGLRLEGKEFAPIIPHELSED
jgi:hypothetical protein